MLGDRVTTGWFAVSCLTSLTPIAMIAGALAPMALVSPVMAQVQSVTPYYALVTQDKATVRSGENDRFYKVGELNTGEVLMVDGEGNSWSRIAYPPSFTAYVRAEDVQIEGATAKLTVPSKLKAGNATSGYSGSWKSLLDAPLPAGTTLKIIEPAKEGEGVVGYRIAVPDSARAFVETRALRHATDAEVTAFKSKGAVPALPMPTSPNPPATKPAGPQPDSHTPAGPGPTPVGPATPVPGKPVAGQPVNPPVPGQPADVKAPEATASPDSRAVGTIEQLEVAFKKVWAQPIMSSEVSELMTEYQRAIDAAPEDSSLRRSLQQRVDAIKLRLEFRDKMRKQEEARAAIETQKSKMAQDIAAWEKTRVYTIVGQLQPSTVYDGKRLPQMYRIVSVGGASPRTLGYLKTSKEVDLNKMLGQVIGVIGDSTLDRSLMLNIIDPIKVDTLKSAAEVEKEAPAKPSPTANADEDAPEQTPKTPRSGGY